MSSTSTKKKFSFWKLLIWIAVILAVLNIITDGEISDGIEDLYYEIFERDDYVPEPKPAYMGVTVSEVEGITGAYVSAVTPGSPAATAGLLAGDVIVVMGDASINSFDGFIAELGKFHAYDYTSLVVLRNGQYVTCEVNFGVKPTEAPVTPTIPQNTTPQQTIPAGTGPAGTVPPVTTPPATTPPDVDWLSSVPSELRGNVYLNSRGKGYCETMTGKVVATVLFVSDPDAGWSEGEIENAKSQFQTIADRIIADAAKYGAQLDLSLQYKSVTTSAKIVNNETADWMAGALKAAGLPELKNTNPTLEAAYGADSAPVIFIANHGGRAFASSYYGSEYAILYQDTHAFYHEFNHIFGAEDFYYPADVKEFAEAYLPDTIMINSSQGVMDDLTAYLIGWTDTLSDHAITFLQKTSHITREYLSEEHKKETYTGYAADFTYRGGSYTGNLVMGVFHGKGKWIREDGTVWDGTFNNGSFTGKGNIIYTNGDTYDGDWVDGRWHGKGTYTWAEGGSYTGDYVNGERTGHGVLVYSDGARYEGGFLGGKRQGSGTMKYADGSSYVGQWADGVQNGQGTLTYTDGATYVGDWVGGKREGQGTLTYANGNVYTGSWNNDSRNGKGTYKWANGDIYTGDFLDGKFHGQGILTGANGSSYTGGYENGKWHGQGTRVYADGSSYVGQWAEGVQSGKGTLTYADGATYVGDWVGGKREGQGTLTYANGNVYTGSWSNNTWNGEGTFTWTSGDKYTGSFVDGKRHGYGIYYYPGGNRYEGNWVAGERHGQGTMYYANGTVQSGTWDNGKFVK